MIKPKLLVLTPQNPYPPVDGGKIGIYFPIVYLSNYFDIILVFPVKNMDDEEKTKKHFLNYRVNVISYKKDTKNDILPLMCNFLKKEPFKWDKYYSHKAQNLINYIIEKENIQAILVSAPHMAKFAIEAKKKFSHINIFLREHNIEYKLVEQFRDNIKNPVLRFLANWQLNKSTLLEVSYWKLFNKVFFISDLDYEIAVNSTDELKNKFIVVYDGFEPVINDCNNIEIYKNSNFIYTANLKTIQNNLSFKWFIKEIWLPNLDTIKRVGLKLFITGNDREMISKTINIRDFESLNIVSLGFVDNVNDEIIKYKYVLSPTIIGSGLRLKILNGMACGKPVFVTPLDLNTCKVFKDMENIICFKNQKDFINKIEYLEKNESVYSKIACNAIKTIKEHFNWNKYAEIIFNSMQS